MRVIGQAVKRTYLRQIVRQLRARKALQQWTAHDAEILLFYSRFVSCGSLCFDVGANMGNRVKVLLRLGARVVAVEPQDECVQVLRAVYSGNRCLTVVQKALGESEGQAEMMIGNANTISSLSLEWIEAVRRSGRFLAHSWNKKQVVQITTLDRMIEQYGTPSFIKIDVEGFELHVVRGLSQPVKMLSLEFTPELVEPTLNCIDHLRGLGKVRLNYSLGETMRLALEEWVPPQEMVRILSGFRGNSRLYGDVYAQFSI